MTVMIHGPPLKCTLHNHLLQEKLQPVWNSKPPSRIWEHHTLIGYETTDSIVAMERWNVCK